MQKTPEIEILPPDDIPDETMSRDNLLNWKSWQKCGKWFVDISSDEFLFVVFNKEIISCWEDIFEFFFSNESWNRHSHLERFFISFKWESSK